MKITVKEAHNLNLKQCEDIKANQYRSKDAKTDYYPESIENRLYELLTKQAERETKQWERLLKMNLR